MCPVHVLIVSDSDTSLLPNESDAEDGFIRKRSVLMLGLARSLEDAECERSLNVRLSFSDRVSAS